MRCFTTHLGIRLRRILRCAASGASGTRPLEFPSFLGVGTGACARPPCLAGTFCVDDRPLTHFFVKKKIHPCVRGKTCDAPSLCQRSRADARWGVQTWAPHRGAFFFTKKAYCRNQTICVAERGKSVQTQPPLFPPLKKPFKNYGFQGDLIPLAEVWGRRPQGLSPSSGNPE